jgi:hypothetical protein
VVAAACACRNAACQRRINGHRKPYEPVNTKNPKDGHGSSVACCGARQSGRVSLQEFNLYSSVD